MRILIVLVVALLFAALGGFVGGIMTDEGEPYVPLEPTTQPEEQARRLRESFKALGEGAEVARQRNRNMTIGGTIGLVAGVAIGLLVASRLPNRTAPSTGAARRS